MVSFFYQGFVFMVDIIYGVDHIFYLLLILIAVEQYMTV